MDDEQKLKAAFAAFLIETNVPFEAALRLYPSEKDRGRACQISFEWPNDPFVIIELERLKTDGAKNKDIPSKEEVIAEMWRQVKNERTPAKDKAATARLVAEMLRYIPKAEADEENKGRMPSAPVYKIVSE